MKTRTWKKLGIILGVLALVLVIIGIVTPMFLDLNRYHGFIVSEVEKAVGGKVKLGRISWGLTHRIWLEVDGFSIIDASAFPGDVKLTRIYASVSIPRGQIQTSARCEGDRPVGCGHKTHRCSPAG